MDIKQAARSLSRLANKHSMDEKINMNPDALREHHFVGAILHTAAADMGSVKGLPEAILNHHRNMASYHNHKVGV